MTPEMGVSPCTDRFFDEMAYRPSDNIIVPWDEFLIFEHEEIRSHHVWASHYALGMAPRRELFPPDVVSSANVSRLVSHEVPKRCELNIADDCEDSSQPFDAVNDCDKERAGVRVLSGRSRRTLWETHLSSLRLGTRGGARG